MSSNVDAAGAVTGADKKAAASVNQNSPQLEDISQTKPINIDASKTEAIHPPPETLFEKTKPSSGKWMSLIRQLLKPAPAAANRSDEDGDASPSPEYCNREVVDNLCSDVMEVFKAEESLLDVKVDPEQTLVIVGDVHGQFGDLIYHILTQQEPGRPDRKFLFMGDYVDRGPQGVETIMLLFALKCEFPNNVFILRGNHEEAQTSRFYGFLVEVRSKFSDATVWARFVEVFCHIPLSALCTVPDGRRFLCVHGGLSPQLALVGVEGIRNISRSDYQVMLDNEESSIVDGLLWSDPTDTVPNFWPNERGCGFLFGPVATKEFCEANKLQFLCRAHQMTMEGYTWTHENKCLTVFSAPNYCRISGNLGAVVEVSAGLSLHYRQYSSVADLAPGSPGASNPGVAPKLPYF